MEFLRPGSLEEALTLKGQHPGAVPIAGGTDVMVEINFDQRRPAALLDLTRVTELTNWARNGGGWLRVGAGVSYARLIGELGSLLPGLAMAARTVGSPQIRNRGTIGGNLGAASPAGDCHPVLLAAGADIEVASVRGTRLIPVAEFFTGPKRNALEPDELITAVLLPVAPGPQQFAKIGTRNAMVIAVCAFALELRPPAPPTSDNPISDYPKWDEAEGEEGEEGRVGTGIGSGRVGTGIGSAGPTPLRALDAEEFLAARLPWGEAGTLPESLVREFGDLVAAAARPIDDVRGTAAYRRHALSVLARRTLTWAWEEQACA